jgi:dinuclear metal center YbgI/SA1388 family protein
MIVKDVTKYLEKIAPLNLQESYDNSGLQVGDYKSEVKGILVSLDVTLEVIEDAIQQQCNLIVAHHPVIFGEIKNLNKSSLTGSIVFKAIKNNINIYAIHTNLDNVPNGVNGKIAEVIGLKRKKILLPKQNLLKLVVFVPESHSEKVSQALFSSGAGNIGNYKNCIFSSFGQGSFLPISGSKPFMGKEGEVEKVKEEKLEVIFPDYILPEIIQSMNRVHPYEEVAYDIFKLQNNSKSGSGLIGELEKPMEELKFLNLIKKKFNVATIKHTKLINKPIKKIAVCGGSGSFLLKNAIIENADIFITSDFKYHQFFEADNSILIADIGHYESEQFTIDLISDFLMKKFINFAIRLTKVNTNPINYL